MIMEMTDNLIDRVLENGTEIGRQLPCRESKGMYYAIYRYDGVVYAINFDRDDNSLNGEEITEDQISEYLTQRFTPGICSCIPIFNFGEQMKRFLKQIMTVFSGQRSIQIELDKALTRISFLEFQLSVKELEKRQKQLCIDNLKKTLREIEISLGEENN